MTQDILRLIKSSALNSSKAQVGVFIYLGTHFLPHSKLERLRYRHNRSAEANNRCLLRESNET